MPINLTNLDKINNFPDKCKVAKLHENNNNHQINIMSYKILSYLKNNKASKNKLFKLYTNAPGKLLNNFYKGNIYLYPKQK